jgi:hypothetical protein
LLAEGLLVDDARRQTMQQAAYEFVRDQLPLRSAAAEIAAVAEGLGALPVRTATGPRWRSGRPSLVGEGWSVEAKPKDAGLGAIRAGVKHVALELIAARRKAELDRLEASDLGDDEATARTSAAYGAASPRVSVLVTVYNYASPVRDALDSAEASRYRELEIVVVDDGSTDDSWARVLQWIAEHEELAVLLARHPANRGLGAARNTALKLARGSMVFILDADNQLFPTGLERLVDALDDDPSASFAYGMIQRCRAGLPHDLISEFPWSPEKVRRGNYIDAMALIRTDELRQLGGYTTDLRLHGAEDYDLWCRMAEHGRHAAFVPEIVASYRMAAHSMQSLTNLSVDVLESLLAETYPLIRGGFGAAR